jgi:hypothetical protein
LPLSLAVLPPPSVIPATASIPRSPFCWPVLRDRCPRIRHVDPVVEILFEPAVIRVLLERDAERRVADERAPLDPVVV